MKLETWLSQSSVPDADFALRIGVRRQTLWRYKVGNRIPRPSILSRIQKETDGEVGPADFFGAASVAGRVAA